MAVIRLGLGSQASGSLGGTVFSHNRFGAYVRARSVPVNPSTDRQVEMRSILNSLTIAWYATLTEVQRLAWEAYAENVTWNNAVGDSVNLTGLSMYLRSNSARIQGGLSAVDDAPTIFLLAPTPLVLSAVADIPNQELDVTFDNGEQWANEDGGALLVAMGSPVNGSLRYIPPKKRFMGTVLGNGTTAPTSPAALPAPFALVATQQVRVYARATLADGRLSEIAQATFLVA